MAVKTYKPTSSGRRFAVTSAYTELTGDKPEKSLLHDQRHSGGRNNQGKITCRHIGGGNRTKYRIIDFKRAKDGIPATVKSIQYDPNRSANIALLAYADGVKTYILAPVGLNVGDKLMSGPAADIKVGNALPLENIPVGTMVHNIELTDRQKRGYVRADHGYGRQIRHVENAQRRNEACASALPRDDRPGRQCRARNPFPRQSGQSEISRPASRSERRGHEPCGSPSRRRRRQSARGPCGSRNSLGQARSRL